MAERREHEPSSPPPLPELTSSSQASSSPFPMSHHDSDSPNQGDGDWGSEDFVIPSSPPSSHHNHYPGHDSAFYPAHDPTFPATPSSPSPDAGQRNLSAIHPTTYWSSSSKHPIGGHSVSVYGEHRMSPSNVDIRTVPIRGPRPLEAASMFPGTPSTPSDPYSLLIDYDGFGKELSRKVIHTPTSTGPARREPGREARPRPAPYAIHPRNNRNANSRAPPSAHNQATPWIPHPSRDDSLPGAVAELGPFILNAAAEFHTSCVVCYALKGELADHKLDDCKSGICHTAMNPDYGSFRNSVATRVPHFCFFCNLPQATPIVPFGFHPPNKAGARNCPYSEVIKPLCYVVARVGTVLDRLKTTTNFDVPDRALPEMKDEWVTFFRHHDTTHLFPNFIRVFLWLLHTQEYDKDNAALTGTWK